jgi:hypothetical protein
MIGSIPLIPAAESVETLAVPSIEAVQGTFAAIEGTVEMVAADCRTVAGTLSDLNEALGTISQGAGVSQWGGMGLISLPIMGAIKAVKTVAGQYVKQQTGTPLATWTELVANSTAQVEAYLAGLGTVAGLAQRYSASAGTAVDPRQAGEDEQVLRAIRWQTQAWKQVLGRVAQLGRLVDAILAADVGEEPEPPEQAAPARLAGFSGTVQRRIKEVQSRTTERSGDLRQWVLQPFVDLHDRVRQLPSLTEQLAREVALLEILLELEIVELRVCQGEIPPAEARIVRLRVAASALLPELARRLADARRRAADYGTYLDRIEGARRAGEVTEPAYAVLVEEYRRGLDGTRAQLAALEAEADRWRRDGPALLQVCADWVTLELNVVAARRLAEQRQPTDDRAELLLRERDRLAEAGRLLAAL